MILSLTISKKIYNEFKVKILARRMKLFILCLCFIYYMGLAVRLHNFLNIIMIRNMFTLKQAIPLIGVILIYYSVGTSLKQT